MNQQKSNPFSFSTDDLISAPDNNASKYKILLVEDDFALAQEILTTLARAGMECRHTTDGPVALEALRSKDFHLLLLDLCLPQKNGQEICRQARKISTLPLIVLMQHEEQDAQLKCFGLGADDYLCKPFSSQLLLLRVVSLLRRSYVYDHKKHKYAVPISSIPLAAPIRPPQAQGPSATPLKMPVTTVSENDEGAPEIPVGWSLCESCNYMGPTPKFQTQNGAGQAVMACPHCGDKSNIEYALG